MSTKTVTPYTSTKTTTYNTETQKKRFAVIFGAIAGSVALVLSTVALIVSQIDVNVPIY